MTDDELKAAISAIKPKVNWVAIIAGACAIAGSVWGATQYIGDIPKRPEFKAVTDDVMRIRIELPVMNAKLERNDQSQQRMEKAIERIEGKLDERKGRRGQ